jgi:4-hydroxy-tetrahydrodipicolinate synthase
MIPALKACIAHYAQDPAWLTVRPPLVELPGPERASLAHSLAALDFSMPGLTA